MTSYPAIDVTGAPGTDDDATGLVLAAIDDFSPIAIEEAEHEGRLTIFFTDAAARDGAREALTRAFPAASITSRDVDDEDWARRSQANLRPVTVGRVTIAPPWAAAAPPPPDPRSVTVVIQPSMGFGTGHHATTRLCLSALQRFDLQDAVVLDVGTGSGVLAICARRLGAARTRGIDNDADAIQSARENLTLNAVDEVQFDIADLVDDLRLSSSANRPDVILANLTGAALIRHGQLLLDSLRHDGALIASGFLEAEQPDVLRAFGTARVVWSGEDEGWIGVIVRRS